MECPCAGRTTHYPWCPTLRPTTQVLYEFNLDTSCGHTGWVTVWADTMEPVAGVYRCPVEGCGCEEAVPV